MSLLGKLFGKKSEPQPATSPVAAASNNPADDPNLIRVFDNFGRELFLTREQWRDNVLLGNLEKAWNHPDELSNLIISALNDGFSADVLKAAEQLHRIDPMPDRGACLYGIVLMKNNRLGEAERILQTCLNKHGENGSVLTNLAKVYAAQNQHQKADETLWRALEIDPNQDNGLLWFAAMQRERGGPEAELKAFQRVAALPASWRAQVWLARAALDARNLDQALFYYRESLARAEKPVPADLLMQITGDLGNRGFLIELLQLAAPHFDIHQHGLQVGNNLIKANLDLGQIEPARRILDQLFAQQRPDWKQALSFWDTEIAKARLNTAEVAPKKPLRMAMLNIDGPVWLKPSSPAAELFPAKTSDALSICFLGSTAEVASNSQRPQMQLSDNPGRLSRALPLFLAEQTHFGTDAQSRTLIPWIAEPGGGFVLSGGPWQDEDAAAYARQSESKNDYLVISHLKTQVTPHVIELRLVRTIDGKCLGELKGAFHFDKLHETIPALLPAFFALLAEHAEIAKRKNSQLYHPPAAAGFPDYLLRLEQLLALRCAAMDAANAATLNGEREIIDGNLQLCVAYPENIATRILLAQTMLVMKKIRPAILSEFKDKLMLLQREKPLPEPAHGVMQRLWNEALSP